MEAGAGLGFSVWTAARSLNLVVVTLTVQNRMVVMTSVMVKLVADLLSLKWRENWGGTPAFLPWLLEERILKHSCTWLGLRGNRCRICLP